MFDKLKRIFRKKETEPSEVQARQESFMKNEPRDTKEVIKQDTAIIPDKIPSKNEPLEVKESIEETKTILPNQNVTMLPTPLETQTSMQKTSKISSKEKTEEVKVTLKENIPMKNHRIMTYTKKQKRRTYDRIHREIKFVLEEHKILTTSEVGRLVGLPQKYVKAHLEYLEDKGIVSHKTKGLGGQWNYYFLTKNKPDSKGDE
jgi:site-specific DNA-cytosine methylase